ncbi:SDR family NAD(P)-dependent oxidoreductase [Limosilactobacillus reuteri]|uniref:SDR family NAD(P)-dependent oxidoreductase n=1 Tax=Limosilactobacillus reuteri TaxID=1598 RepID=UPI001C5BDCBF|nr:SDR family oxidoreductase [Limosilactobacillus reuteri]MBW3350465.1 SDR family oxidoreductase [Limosilactobacillus reuteri]UUW68671.1 SDR family oxidoreductase [Limosilactobacillus reuteri]
MQTVVITGGTSGIGLATADIFLKNGWNAVLIGRDAEKGMQVERQLGKTYSPAQVTFIQADISKSSEVEHVKQITLNKFKTVDAIVNNAGIVIHGEVHETSEEDWDKIFDVDVKGTFLVSKAFLPTMIEQDHGSIVNISSVSGMAGDRAMVAYNAAKGAIINMTRAMAIDYGKNNIRVNVVAPGPTNTPLFHQDKQKFAKNSPLNRIVEPEEVAAAIYFVASPAASAITGEVIPVTAGFEISTGQPM